MYGSQWRQFHISYLKKWTGRDPRLRDNFVEFTRDVGSFLKPSNIYILKEHTSHMETQLGLKTTTTNTTKNKTQKMQMQKKNIQKYICIMEVCRPKEVFAEVHEVNLTWLIDLCIFINLHKESRICFICFFFFFSCMAVVRCSLLLLIAQVQVDLLFTQLDVRIYYFNGHFSSFKIIF